MLAIAKRLTPSQPTAILRRGVIVLGGVAVMAACARTQIPFWPVPMTLHTLAVMGFAVALGPRLAGSIFLAYLAAGAAGLPVFSGTPERGIGVAYMAGPTGGYLLGYLIASWQVGWLAAGRGTVGRIGAMLAGLLPIYGLGITWLAVFVPADRLLALGVMPFMAGDLIKVTLVAVGGAVLAPRSARSVERRP